MAQYDVNKVLKIATNEVGYLEKISKSQLDSKTGNAGYNNYTKYARDLDAIPKIYNGKKQGYAWCDVFVDWCFVQAYGVEGMQYLLGQPNKSLGAGCKYSANYFRNKNRFYTSNPRPGDVIYFGKRGNESHTGIVENVVSGKVYTIEGNTSGAAGVVANGGGVFRKSYSVNNSRIAGYGRPPYNMTISHSEPINNKEKVCKVEVKQLAKGSEGGNVKALQLLLIAYGYSCGSYGADGDFGSATDSAVRKYQKAKGLSVDGIVGTKTWNKLLGN